MHLYNPIDLATYIFSKNPAYKMSSTTDFSFTFSEVTLLTEAAMFICVWNHFWPRPNPLDSRLD